MTETLAPRPWLPAPVSNRVAESTAALGGLDATGVQGLLAELVAENGRIHDETCLNLNPATNRMNPRAEEMLSARLGSRASLGYPGEKYETGLEAIEQIEVIAAELAARVFHASFAEVRVGSGALANLYSFMAVCEPGDTIIAPPATIAGHVTHHGAGAAGLYRLRTVPAPVDASTYTVDLVALAELARVERPRMITIGGSLNLTHHPVAQIREIADDVGAVVLFDAAHLGGVIAGGAWPNPLDEGAHLMSMSTYKSLGGPPGGLLLGNDPALAERIEAIAYPGLTANFDAGKTAALAQTMLDWQVAGRSYARAMVDTAAALAEALVAAGVPVFRRDTVVTRSHQFAVEAAAYGGGQTAAARLRRANLLACGIGLPIDPVEGDLNGLRIGTPELARLGMTVEDMPVLAGFIARALTGEPEPVAAEVTAWRSDFRDIHFTTDRPD
ncbi:aminotransferase class I/II-fold pyridoxal phosphate-dependent enzyme [Nocardioides glacieisoli]|uniref:Aminotransferase class I/II-fold pyridoxal phosphate-dependent enzyme n=1 Tax=Nocardioides glacieisoli TaxID=1168730 RepID=A0A4Q2RK96_9ACTN|nr:aminotransferase class I/II-fold pyridoxal phosphate-dependent enzyme [Nocardioides glacieisoli]RYB89141.1 aminotransferase class I/II-fold pyridoxal phosphate-dependent enzyme [Nocardioides glacieisoli]